MEHLFTELLQANQKEFLELTQDILDSNLLLVGETHGVKENAFLYYSLFKLFEFDTIILGWPKSLEEPFRNFMASGIFPIHSAVSSLSDGNVNKTYLLMLKQLHSDGLAKNIIFIGPDQETFSHWNDKEKASFENFKKEYTEGSKALIIMQSSHVGTEPFTSEEANLKSESGMLIPLGFHLRNHYGTIPICKIIYHSGQYYSFGVNDFPKSHMPEHMLQKSKTIPKEYEIHLNKTTAVDP